MQRGKRLWGYPVVPLLDPLMTTGRAVDVLSDGGPTSTSERHDNQSHNERDRPEP